MKGIRWILRVLAAIGLLAGTAGNWAAAQTGLPAGNAPAKAADTAPAQSLADAQALAAKGRLEQALAELNTLAKAEPEEAGVERLRGTILYQKEQLPQAQAAFARAVAEDAGDRESMEMEGITLYRLGKPLEAIPLLEKADTESSGANADPHYVLGLCYSDAKRYDDARHAFAMQFGFPPDSAEAYLITARLLLRRQFVDQAAIFAHKALEVNPSIPTAHQLLGEIALAKANVPQAVTELEAEEKLNPVDGLIYDRLGDAYVRTGQFEKARVALNKAVLLEPNATGPYILLGEALIELGQPIQAIHYLDHAVSMDPGNYITHNFLGQAYRALGEQTESVREFKMAVALQQKNDPKPVRAR
jgi:tetratricopeptide (TPR) repeat protein